QARRTPEATALESGDRRFSYTELIGETRRLADRLRAYGVGPGVVAAVCFERSADMVLALLAILEAGGAYLPLDPAHPAERHAYVLADSRAVCVIGSKATLATLPAVE